MPDELKAIFERAFREFLSREHSGIQIRVNERSLCGRLGIYLENAGRRAGLKGYYADTEYNRKQDGRVKTILDSKQHVIRINCDLILHSRGEIVARDNLIAVEIKKADRPEREKDSDRARLRALTKASYDNVWSYDGKTLPEHVCGYELGFFIQIDARKSTFTIEEFRHGGLVETRTSKIESLAATPPPRATRRKRPSAKTPPPGARL